MYLMTCHYQLKAGSRPELLAALKEHDLAARFRQEPGAVEYAYLLPPEEPDVLRVLEIWEDRESFDAHKSCPAAEVWKKLSPQYVLTRNNHGYEAAEA